MVVLYTFRILINIKQNMRGFIIFFVHLVFKDLNYKKQLKTYKMMEKNQPIIFDLMLRKKKIHIKFAPCII